MVANISVYATKAGTEPTWPAAPEMPQYGD